MATLQDYVYIQPGIPFVNICSIGIFSVNLAYYLIFSGLVVFTVYQIASSIYNIAKSDSSETFEKLKENVTGIVLSVVGLLVVSSALFFPKLILQTMGVSDANNPFLNFGGCSSEDFISDPIDVGDFTYIPGEGVPTAPGTPGSPGSPGTAPGTPGSPGSPGTPGSPSSTQIPSSTQMPCSGDPIPANAINIGTFNIGDGNEFCNGCQRNPNEATTLAGAINDFKLDIFALQEVGNASKGNEYANSAEQFIAAVQATYPGKTFYTAVSQHGGSTRSFSNMIFSKYPLKDEQNYALTTKDEITRYLQSAVAETPYGDVVIFNIHTKTNNACQQAGQALEIVKSVAAGRKFVILGDFNVQLRYLLRDSTDPTCAAIPTDVKNYFDASCFGYLCQHQLYDTEENDIDHIVTSKGSVNISQKCDAGNYAGMSDHNAIIGTIVLN